MQQRKRRIPGTYLVFIRAPEGTMVELIQLRRPK
jgi:hypothetical protein